MNLLRGVRPGLVMVGCTAALAWGQADVRPPGATLSVEQGGFSVFWQAQVPIGAGESLESGFLRDEALYVTTDGGAAFSLHADTGLLRWGEILTEPAYTVFPPSHVQTADGRGPVVIPTTNQVYIKDRYTGNDIVRFRAQFPVGSAAVGIDGLLLIGSTNGRLIALGWDPARPAEPVKRWEVDAGGPITASPVLYPQRNLLIASQNGVVYSCEATNKRLTWKFKVGGPIFGDPVVDPSGVYVASMDRSLYKLSAKTGSQLWQARFPDPLRTGPAVAAQTVYQFSSSQGITALDAMTGKEKWQRREARQFLAHGQTGDVLLSGADRLLIVDGESGKITSTVAVTPVRAAVTNTVSESVYLLGEGGVVQCLRREKVPYLRKQQVEMARETLNTPPPRPGQVVAEPPLRKPPAPVREDPFRSRKDVPSAPPSP